MCHTGTVEPKETAKPIDEVAALLDGYRPDGRRLREVVCLLTEGPSDLATLVRRSALPRRTVEEVLAAADGDLVRDGEAVVLASAQVASYRRRFGYESLRATRLADPLAPLMADAAEVLRVMQQVIAEAPAAKSCLDHVQATPETAVRRALWLNSTYDLRGATLLCLGDHDLTSLAVGQVAPSARIVVADVDERTLEYIDQWAARLQLDIRGFVSDFRVWLAESATKCADLVFTDPPYTPEGLTLFSARALQSLANQEHGRVVVAYGYSDRQPTLGLQGQSAAHRLGLAAEEQLRAFNRYNGAQAVGSASDLYVWRPTSRSWRQVDGVLADMQTNIYTRGGQSLEGTASAGQQDGQGWGAVPPAVLGVTAEDGFPLRVVIADGWTGQQASADRALSRVRLATLFHTGIPVAVQRRRPFSVAADLHADPGAWLLRVLLAVNADRVAAVVSSGHRDVRDEAGQRSLAALVGAKYSLRFLRGQPDADHTTVVATALADGSPSQAVSAASWLLHRAHGKVGNVWRDGLLASARDSGKQPLTKREARSVVDAGSRRPDLLSARLIDLPRHQIAGVLEDAALVCAP
jgi:predicted methyltransferase